LSLDVNELVGVDAPMTFGEQLKQARVAAGLTQTALSRSLGVSVPYLSDVERGNRPALTLERARAAAESLGAPWLVDRALEERLGPSVLDVSGLTDEQRREVEALVSQMRAA
jgi:transcriptional regulator with XRE-family HTH domain